MEAAGDESASDEPEAPRAESEADDESGIDAADAVEGDDTDEGEADGEPSH